MSRFLPLTEDKITGKVAPLGEITGFPRSHVRSVWSDNPPGKPLTDGKIRWYAGRGKFFRLHPKPKVSKRNTYKPTKKELEEFA